MGQGSYVIAEWDSIQRDYPAFQQSFQSLESKAIGKCNLDWSPKKFNLNHSFGGGDAEYGRTTILPGIWLDHADAAMVTYRQAFTSAFLAANPTQFTLMYGCGSGHTIPEDCKVALAGFAFPNKEQHITEIKFQIGDRKYGRIELEQMLIMNKPALIFEEGWVLDEEEAVDLYCHFDTLGLTQIGAWTTLYQRVVPIGALYYKYYQKVGGNTGTAVTTQ